MTVELDKDDLINMLSSVIPTNEECIHNAKYGWMYFCDLSWKWDRQKLQEFSENDLWWLYNKYKSTMNMG